MRRFRVVAGVGGAIVASALALTGARAEDPFADYRAMLGDDNPAELVEMQGEALWTTPRGPKNASLEQCDLGKGPGVIDGVYAILPRYFADVDQVMDLEARLLHCMVTLQGLSREELLRKPFSEQGEMPTDLEALTTFVVERSRGAVLDVPQAHPKEKAAYALGEQLFHFRGGPYDFACATCHSEPGKRIRLQNLPDLTTPAGAQAAYTTWPAYRVSQGAVRTMEWRMVDCLRQQRMPELVVGSEAAIALITFMAVNANGGTMAAPSLKR